MAIQKQIPGPTFEPLAELGRKYAVQGEALQKRSLDTRPPPTTLEQVAVCKLMLDHLDLIEPWDRCIRPILETWLRKTKLPKRTLSGKDVAELVDLVDADKTKESQLRARKMVAKALRMRFDAVKHSHNRYGKLGRNKSR